MDRTGAGLRRVEHPLTIVTGTASDDDTVLEVGFEVSDTGNVVAYHAMPARPPYLDPDETNEEYANATITADTIRHAEELADCVESDEVTLDRASHEVTRGYKKLLAAVIERGWAEDHVTQAVAELREAGGSWNLIGPALGISRQSAREKYALIDDNS